MKSISPLFLIFFLFTSFSSHANDRVALVLGNQAYQQAPLKNPINDAKAIGDVLENRMGFNVIRGYDLGRTGMENALDKFGALAEKAKIAMVYYAGHAIQVDGVNYLIPANTPVGHRRDLKKLINLTHLVDEAQQASGLGVVMLDACRNNPFANHLKRSFKRSIGGRGLARIEDAPSNILIGFATKENAVADDGGNNHSPYAEALLEYLPQKNLEIRLLFGKVHDAVKNSTKQQQQPYTYGALGGTAWFLANKGTTPAPSVDEPEMIAIKGGCFQMGQRAEEKQWLIQQSDQKTYDKYYSDEKRHKRCVDAFYLAKYEVTRGEFRRFITATGYRTDAEKDSNKGCYALKESQWQWVKGYSWQKTGYQQTDTHPVACVSWNDAIAYANWLKGQTGKDYHLPTEAQWEYAARAGTKTMRYWGDDKSNQQACRYENIADSLAKEKYNFDASFSCRDGYAATAPVGRFATNRLGLNDMLGNVVEWTCSAYDKTYGGSENQCVTGNDKRSRVLRGGSWYFKPWNVRSAYRSDSTASYRYNYVGFRLSRTR